MTLLNKVYTFSVHRQLWKAMKTAAHVQKHCVQSVCQFSSHTPGLNLRFSSYNSQLSVKVCLFHSRLLSSWPGQLESASQVNGKLEKVMVENKNSSLIPQNDLRELYSRIIDAFPPGIEMAFAYGSGAFQQHNSLDQSKNMLDFIFVVNKPKLWHRQNLQCHPHHYSFLKRLGPHTISGIQDR